MFKRTRQQAGKLAKERGSQFESLLCNCARAGNWRVLEIPDGCIPTKFKLIRVKSPFDFVFIKGPKVLFCDAKTLEANTFPYSAINHDQLIELAKPMDEGHFSGYIILMRQGIETNTYFATCKSMLKLRPRESLKPADMIHLGAGYEIDLDRIYA